MGEPRTSAIRQAGTGLSPPKSGLHKKVEARPFRYYPSRILPRIGAIGRRSVLRIGRRSVLRIGRRSVLRLYMGLL
jgi:hypothetical protein